MKPVLYFPPHLFSAPLLYFLRQASYLSDIHSDEHQIRMVKLGKTQDTKTLTKHSKTSQDSQSKFTKCRPLAFTQVHSRTCHCSMALSMTDCCIPDHAAIRRRFRSSTLCIGVWHSIQHDTPKLVIHWKIHWQHICQKLSKSAQDQQCYCKNKKGAVFLKHSVVCSDCTNSTAQLNETYNTRTCAW